jgi:hypothetical protein
MKVARSTIKTRMGTSFCAERSRHGVSTTSKLLGHGSLSEWWVEVLVVVVFVEFWGNKLSVDDNKTAGRSLLMCLPISTCAWTNRARVLSFRARERKSVSSGETTSISL